MRGQNTQQDTISKEVWDDIEENLVGCTGEGKWWEGYIWEEWREGKTGTVSYEVQLRGDMLSEVEFEVFWWLEFSSSLFFKF